MKKIIALLLIVCCMPAVAQKAYFTPSYDYELEYFKGWTSIRLSYLPSTIESEGFSDTNLDGLMISYIESFGISKSTPFYIESGVGISYIGGEVNNSDVSLDMFSVNVPLNIGYCHHVSRAVTLCPFVGLTFRYNISGNIEGYGERVNVFDKDELDSATAKRFNVGWQAGLGITFGGTVGLTASYGRDFNKLFPNGKWCVPQLGVAIHF